MEKLETLTKKQERLMDQIAEEYIRDLTVPREPDMAVIERWLDIAYGLFDMKRPARAEIVGSPEAALKLEFELTGQKQTSLDWCGVGEGGWVSFYDYFQRIGVLDKDDAEMKQLIAMRDFARVAYDSILLDECAIVVQRPKVMKLDDQGNLHATDGPCLEWADGERDWAYHGTWMPERVIVSPKSFTRDEYMALTNTEQRRAIGEIAGWAWVAELLGAKPVDAWKDGNTGLEYQLLACADGTKLLKKQSPKLKRGAQPTYFEPVHEDLRTARAARKWQATTLTPAQCESDPDLSYAVEA